MIYRSTLMIPYYLNTVINNNIVLYLYYCIDWCFLTIRLHFQKMPSRFLLHIIETDMFLPVSIEHSCQQRCHISVRKSQMTTWHVHSRDSRSAQRDYPSGQCKSYDVALHNERWVYLFIFFLPLKVWNSIETDQSFSHPRGTIQYCWMEIHYRAHWWKCINWWLEWWWHDWKFVQEGNFLVPVLTNFINHVFKKFI